MARPLNTPTPAFIHVDVDDLWAVAECYGIEVGHELAHAISEDALPRFRELFQARGIRATFFLVGRDLESPGYVENVQRLLADGHGAANHSYSHRLDFRALSADQIMEEVRRCHDLAQSSLGVTLRGFRAPGYAASSTLSGALQRLGYRYDASLMPSPFGGIFRWMDARLQRKAMSSVGRAVGERLQSSGDTKTQYPLFRDSFNSLRPRALPGIPGDPAMSPLIQIPSATTPLLRLPFQAGVCMRLGWSYFRAGFGPFRRAPHLPFIFLFHAADLADFSKVPVPFFQQSSFFGTPVSERLALAQRFLDAISQSRDIITTEEWLG